MPLQPSDLLFPSASHALATALTELTRANLTLTHRFASIARDAAFVRSVAAAAGEGLPVLANERCGSWYVAPELKAGSAYFKSTDGHFGEWGCSLRRLNLQVLDLVAGKGGCIIVDSTRRGKSMPDALSKTIPIWICVLNRLLFPERGEWHALKTPEDVVSASEHAQIEQRIPSFVDGLRSLNLDVDALRCKLIGKPFEPFWVTPASDVSLPSGVREADHHLIVLCTASSRASEALHHSTGYVQGAADDSESWALGLDAATFWAHHAELLSMSEDKLPALIETLVSNAQTHFAIRSPALVRPTRGVWIADKTAAEGVWRDFNAVISCGSQPSPALSQGLQSRYIHLACPPAKLGSRQLRVELPKLERLRSLLDKDSKVLVACPTGKDLAVGAALAIICLFCTADGSLQIGSDQNPPVAMGKTVIKHRLSWIMVSIPDAAPSRATLQSVNAFLMG